jgi:hypothetical protein
MGAAGVLIFTGGLDDATPVFTADTSSAAPLFTHGPFMESKEHLGGFAVVDMGQTRSPHRLFRGRGTSGITALDGAMAPLCIWRSLQRLAPSDRRGRTPIVPPVAGNPVGAR